MDLGEIESIEPFEKLSVPQPPRELFMMSGIGIQGVVEGGTETHILDRIEYPEEGGILVYIRDCPFPKKGFPFPEALLAINLAKKILIEGMKLSSKFWLLPLYLLRRKNIEKLLESYNKIALINLESYLLRPRFRMRIANEFGDCIYAFLKHLDIHEKPAGDFALIISSIIEYDDSYRYRLEDIASETTKEMMIHFPRQEIKRLTKIMLERDIHDSGTNNTRTKVKTISKLLSLALLVPSIKRAFTNAIKYSNFKHFQYDISDEFWVSMRGDYDFMGKTYAQRQQSLREKGLTTPQGFKVTI